jgi:phenylalanyl-tRNA synthetase beta chain
MNVEPSTVSIRPYIVCAVLRNVKFTPATYKSFIDLQEKLHQNICRKRSYVAIGTHDLDTLTPPFRYQALPPEQINFVPLTENHGKSYNGRELIQFYREDQTVKHLKPYTDLIIDSPLYPIIYDSKDHVLSLPPIINSQHSKITLNTQNIFIECTATDLTKGNIVLDTMVTMFSEHCATPFTVESVEVKYAEHSERTPVNYTTPLLSQRECETKISEINGTLGLTLTPEKIISYCDRMQLGPARHDASKEVIVVHVPPTRSDILHPVDVIEDVAIAFGYNNIHVEVPKTLTYGAPLPINHFTDLLRAEIARAGYMEMLTHGLCSTAENFTHLQRPVTEAVSLSNPANVEYEVVRTTLIPGALKTLAFNNSLSHKDGIRLFEISDVVIPTAEHDVGARNERHLVALYSAFSSSFEMIHGLADKIMCWTQIQPEESYGKMSLSSEEMKDRKRIAREGLYYCVRPSNDPLFFAGMSADIILVNTTSGSNKETLLGSMGVVHPNVLKNFEVDYPCTILELNVELLM